MKIAFQMDPIERVNIDEDTTFDFALTAFARGHQCYFYLPQHLSLDGAEVVAKVQPIERLQRVKGDHVRLGPAGYVNLAEMDVVMIRQDPPFDMAYITTTHILDHLPESTLVLNRPSAVRDCPEKLFVTAFQGVTPPTLITADFAQIERFYETHKDIIIKPLFGNGGAGIFRIQPGDQNLKSLYELFSATSREPLIAQAYLPAITEGDKRILLLDGEPFGAVNRFAAKGQLRANVHVGGSAAPAQLSERDRELCAIIAPELKARGLVIVGIDVIGGNITEINVTSPTLVQELRRFSGLDYSAALFEWIEARKA